MGGAPVCAVFRIRYYQVDVERVLAPDSRKSAFAAVVTRLASFTVELKLPGLLLRQGCPQSSSTARALHPPGVATL